MCTGVKRIVTPTHYYFFTIIFFCIEKNILYLSEYNLYIGFNSIYAFRLKFQRIINSESGYSLCILTTLRWVFFCFLQNWVVSIALIWFYFMSFLYSGVYFCCFIFKVNIKANQSQINILALKKKKKKKKKKNLTTKREIIWK